MMNGSDLNSFVNRMNWLEDEGFDNGSLIEDANAAMQEQFGECKNANNETVPFFKSIEDMETSWNNYDTLIQAYRNITTGYRVDYNL